MSDETALLAAIRTNPDEDTPRLVFADWLDEHDQPERAEFIRLQCEVARLPPGKEASAKAKKADALLKANKGAWFGSLVKAFNLIEPTPRDEGRLDRGFITALTGNVDTFVKHADALNNFAPCLHTANVWGVQGSVGALLKTSFVKRVAELNLETLYPKSVAALGTVPDWEPFDSLRINFEFSDESDTLEGVSEAAIVRAARRLTIQYGFFISEDDDRDDGEHPAAQEPSLREMRRLKVPNLRGFGIHGLGAESVEELVRWAPFKKLNCLDFGICNITDSAAVTLLSAPRLPKVATLLLNENDVGAPTARALARCPQLSHLKYLKLSWSNFDDKAAKHLAASKTLPAELAMDVSFNNFTERGLALLRKRFGPGVVSREQHG